MAKSAILGLVVLIIAGLGYYLFTHVQSDISNTRQNTINSSISQTSNIVLAGKSALLLDFNNAEYQNALKSDKLIVLYFYTNWCPICREEFPKMKDAFDELDTDKVVGFRINYNDNQTDEFEEEIAREFGVAYQHAKVFLKNGQMILKSPENWEKNKYLEEINKAI